MAYNQPLYIKARQQYTRPQAMLWSENSGTLMDDGSGNTFYVPTGYEQKSDATDSLTPGDFLILSDHNRSPINFKVNRIENRRRTINGRMRSNHIADKLTLDVSWDMIPSRSTNINPQYSTDDNLARMTINGAEEYTVDGGAGGVDLLSWYEDHKGPFFVFLSYDKYSNFEGDLSQYGHLKQYNEVIEMYITGFDYTVQKRGASNFDLWSIRVSLEEV